MKKSILTLTIVALTAFVFGQVVSPPDTTKKVFKNVISINATGLLQQFFNLSQYSYFYNPYMIGYKRIFKSNALRVGVGGHYYSNNGTTNDTIKGEQTRYDFNFGVGFEHYSYLSMRWNLYFGADAILNYRHTDNQSSGTTTTSWRQTTTTYGYGVSPLFGLQFKINSRLSISTETSYDITFRKTVSKNSNTPPSNYDRKSESSGIETQFNAPTSIIFRINI